MTQVVTNARTESFNPTIKQTGRVGFSFTNMHNYRTRIMVRIVPPRAQIGSVKSGTAPLNDGATR